MARYIHSDEIIALIDKVKNGQLISMHFKRVAPKCTLCGKSDKRWYSLTHCPHCGGELSFERDTLAQFGVANPQNTAITPKGVGESSSEAKMDGRIKYYDMNVVDEKTGIRGGYRQCRAENVTRLKIEGEEYIVRD